MYTRDGGDVFGKEIEGIRELKIRREGRFKIVCVNCGFSNDEIPVCKEHIRCWDRMKQRRGKGIYEVSSFWRVIDGSTSRIRFEISFS